MSLPKYLSVYLSIYLSIYLSVDVHHPHQVAHLSPLQPSLTSRHNDTANKRVGSHPTSVHLLKEDKHFPPAMPLFASAHYRCLSGPADIPPTTLVAIRFGGWVLYCKPSLLYPHPPPKRPYCTYTSKASLEGGNIPLGRSGGYSAKGGQRVRDRVAPIAL